MHVADLISNRGENVCEELDCLSLEIFEPLINYTATGRCHYCRQETANDMQTKGFQASYWHSLI